MVHYIRFLKAPILVTKGPKASVKALITITTDLGDDFYRAALPVQAVLLEDNERLSKWQAFSWEPGMRSLSIEIGNIPIAAVWSSLRILVSHRESLRADVISHVDMPEILSAWSKRFGLAEDDASPSSDRVERRLDIAGSVLTVYEECGESIARHLWDAGVALAAYFGDTAQDTCLNTLQTAYHSSSTLHGVLAASALQGFTVIELGSGCGIVGMQIAKHFPKSSILLTDLPEAMDILEYNMTRAQCAENSTLKKAILDWDQELPGSVTKDHFDMILVSDCTYNSDSLHALTATLAALVTKSPHALIVVSMKVRHESEAIFFDLMSEAGFVQIEHIAILLPSRQMEADMQGAIESVDIYTFCKCQN